ncbi:MAG: N-methylproline demethylase, partial [Halofilum sp. (in: g-proteobacteria)]|nr:N-methylproline demethylase [Halofilum sp. (in: g-proteobacteria)]
GEILLYDDNGQHPGLTCAEYLVRDGAALELVTPDRQAGQEIGGTNAPAYLKALYEHGARITPDRRLLRVERADGRLRAVLGNEFADGEETRTVDRVVVEHGTLPLDEVYQELKAGSINGGEVDLDALLAGRPQTIEHNPEGSYRLYRVGDAVASRNIHAALLDALRLCAPL